jgi:murein DD-endopeptidase
MVIKWDCIFKNEQRQFEKMAETEKFVYALLLQYGSPYEWGRENPEGADCSGSVCLALFMATGLLVRTTADDLFRRIFTVQNPKAGSIRAAFFIKNGIAAHVAGLVDDETVLNAQEGGAKVRSLDRICGWFWQQGHSSAVRGLDRGALEKLCREGARHGLDGIFNNYFDRGGV